VEGEKGGLAMYIYSTTRRAMCEYIYLHLWRRRLGVEIKDATDIYTVHIYMLTSHVHVYLSSRLYAHLNLWCAETRSAGEGSRPVKPRRQATHWQPPAPERGFCVIREKGIRSEGGLFVPRWLCMFLRKSSTGEPP
jgi:hypothetical protein